MKHHLLLFLTLLLTVGLQAQIITTTATYTSGDIPTTYSTSYDPTCNGATTPFVVNIPAGDFVYSIDVSYDMTAGSGGWMTEQYSQIYCQDTGNEEGQYYSGEGNSSATFSYNRTGLDIANGVDADGILTFEMRAFRTWGGLFGTCGTEYQKVDNGTWTISVKHGAPPTCLYPTHLNIAALGGNEVSIGWTQSGSSTTWDVEVVPDGATPTGTPTAGYANITTNPVTVTGLNPSTDYDFYVRAVCGTDDYSVWVGPYSFTTSCLPYTIPYNEGFESGYSDNQPVGGCLFQQSEVGVQSWIANTTETNFKRSPRTGSWNAFLRYNNTDWIFIPVTLTGGTSYRAEIYARQDGITLANANMSISYSTTPDSTNIVSEIVAATELDDNYQKIFGDFTPATTGTYYIGYRGFINNVAWYISIDDIKIDLTPPCQEPENNSITAANITATSADISWTAQGEATTWEVVTQPAGTGTPTGSGIPTSSNPYTISELSPATDYEVYVRSNCGNGDLSAWTGPLNFSTVCAPISEFNEDFDGISAPNFPNCWGSVIDDGADGFPSSVQTYQYLSPNTPPYHVSLYNSSSPDTSNTILVTPELSNLSAGTHRLRFYAKNTAATQDLQVGTITNPNDGSTFTPLMDVDITENYAQYSVDFAGYTGTDTYIAIRRLSTTPYTYVLLDNIIWEPLPNCIEPSALTVSGVTSNSANIAWTAGTETTWKVMVQPAGTGTPTTAGVSVTTNPYLATELTPSTNYEVYVRADCGNESLSPWVGPVNFNTTCAAFTPTYLEDFSSMSGSNPPECWDEGSNTSVSDGPNGVNGSWTADGFMNDGSSGAARVNLYVTGKKDWLISPEIAIPATGSFEVKYDFGITEYNSTNIGNLGSDDQVLFLISVNGGAWTTLTTYDNTFVTPEGGALGISLNLDAYLGQNVRFAFWATEGSVDDDEDIDVFVSNFMVKERQANDIGVIGITAPTSGCGLGTEAISIQVKNYGYNTQGGFFTHYSVNGVVQTVAPDGFVANNLESEDTASYTFTTQYDFSEVGNYEIKAWTALEGDGESINDTVTIYIDNQALISSFPYNEDFETSNGGYVVANLSNISTTKWEWGTPAAVNISAAASGDKAWVTNLTGDYESSSNTHLISPCFDFSSLDVDPILSFALWTNTELNWDGVAIYTSVDGGDFSKLGTDEDEGWYNSSLRQEFQGINTFEWDTVSHALTGMAGKTNVKILYIFQSDFMGNFEGVGIDDISIIDPCSSGFGLASDVTNETSSGQSGDGAASVTNTMGVAPLSYKWSTGNPADTTSVISNVNAGTYSVTVTDSKGCKDVLEVVIGATCLSNLTSETTYIPESRNSITGDGSITINIASVYPPYVLNWSNGTQETIETTTATLSGLNSGRYYVTITDAKACSSVDSIVVTAICPVTLGATTLFTTETSPGAGDGTAMVTPSAGTAPYTYLWSNGGTTQVIPGLPAGTYTVTITDANGCTGNASVTISSPPCSSDMGLMLAITHETISGASDGVIAASTSGGTAPYQYTWSNSVVGNTAVNLAPNTYSVTVTDANDCTASASGTVNASSISTPIEEVEGLSSLLLRPNPTSSSSILSVKFDRVVDLEIQVLNIMGQSVDVQKLNEISAADVKIDLKQVPAGIYFVRLKVGNDVHTERIIKQ